MLTRLQLQRRRAGVLSQASYSSTDARWSLETNDGEKHSTNFLFMTTGYYNYETPYTPEFKGMDRFKGRRRPRPWQPLQCVLGDTGGASRRSVLERERDGTLLVLC